MSVKIMGMVFDANLNTTQKFVLLALADHADSEGGSIFPSVETVARKCSLSRSAVEKAIRALEGQGLLIRVREGGGNCTNLWRIDCNALNALCTPVPHTGVPPYHIRGTPVPRTPDPSYNPQGITVPGAPSGAQAAADAPKNAKKPPAKRAPRVVDGLSDLIAHEAFSAPKGTAFTSTTANRLLKVAYPEGVTDAVVRTFIEKVRAMYAWWRAEKPHLSAPGKYESISRALTEHAKAVAQPSAVYAPVEQPDGTYKMEWVQE